MAHEECSGYFQKEADGRAPSGVKGRLASLVYDPPHCYFGHVPGEREEA